MTIEQFLNNATDTLSSAHIPTARLDSLVLLEDAIGKDRAWLLAHTEYVLSDSILNRLYTRLKRRAKHEPLAYIRGKSEFYGREFIVTPHTLQPRPETETMIDLLKELTLNSQNSPLLQIRSVTEEEDVIWHIIDVGTGSGCLGITAKLELPEAKVLATDVSAACLKIAKKNAKKLGTNIKFYQGDLLQRIPNIGYPMSYAILANLPYVPDSHTINEAAMFEPKQAIFGGADGLDLYRRLFKQITNLLKKPQYILTESLPFQHTKLVKIATTAGYTLQTIQDFIQLFKLV